MNPILKRMEDALIAAGDAGDVDAAQVIAAEMRALMKQGNPDLKDQMPVPIGQEGMPASIRATVKEFPPQEQALGGVGTAASLAKEGLKGIVGESDKAEVVNQRALQGATPYTMGGNMLGNVAMVGAIPARVAPVIASGGVKLPAWATGRAAMVGDTAATSGGVNAAITPGSAGDRGGAALMAMGTAAALPGLYSLGAAARRGTTSAGKRIAVGEGLQAELGEDGAAALVKALREVDPGVNMGVSSSAAMRTGNPTLEVLESGSRAQRGDLWRQFDQQNAAARWSALTGRAGTPEELAALRAARDAKTTPMRNEALDDAQVSAQFTRGSSVSDETLRPLINKINDFRTGTARPNRDVQVFANYLEGEIKQGITPEQLYEIRKFITDGIKSGRTDELANAVKAARAQRMEVVKIIDDTLETLSGGGWKEYLKRYAAESPPVTSKTALQDIVAALKRGQPEGAVPTSMGESAAWRTVGNLRDRFGQKEIGGRTFDRMQPDDRALVEALIHNLKKQSDVMQAKGVLGSHTAALTANTGRASNITQSALARTADNVVPFGGAMTAKVFDATGRKAEEELARLLQDPYALAEAIRAAQRAQKVASGFSKSGAAAGVVSGTSR